jgi:hypothetical protein
MKSRLAFLVPAVLMLSCSAGPRPPVITAQQEETVTSGPRQFCDGIRQLIDEASQSYPSFQSRILASEAIYDNECRSGMVKTIHEAKSPPWADLTRCQIITVITEHEVYREYACAGTGWEDPDFLYRMMLNGLQVCLYGQYVIKKDFKEGWDGYEEVTLANGENKIILTLFPADGPRDSRLFLEVSFYQRY